MDLTRLFSHSLLPLTLFVKCLPASPGLPVFSEYLFLGSLPASFRCTPGHYHDGGTAVSSDITYFGTRLSLRFQLLPPSYGSDGTLPIPRSFPLRSPSHSTSADTSHPLLLHSIPSDVNSYGRNTYDSHVLLHCIHRHSSHCAVPVVQQVFLTVIHCFFVRRTFPDRFYALHKLFLLSLIRLSIAVLWLPLLHPASGWLLY